MQANPYQRPHPATDGHRESHEWAAMDMPHHTLHHCLRVTQANGGLLTEIEQSAQHIHPVFAETTSALQRLVIQRLAATLSAHRM